jgi:hypothetical protein
MIACNPAFTNHYKEERLMARALKQVKLKNGKIYFVDWRLKQLRNVDNPHDYQNFVDEEVMATWLADQVIEELN